MGGKFLYEVLLASNSAIPFGFASLIQGCSALTLIVFLLGYIMACFKVRLLCYFELGSPNLFGSTV